MSHNQSPLIRVEEQGDTTIVHFEAERINDFAIARRLGNELQDVLNRPDCRHIVLDFQGLDYVISEVFSVLLRLTREGQSKCCQVRACNLGRFFREIYETMRFQQIIPISESLEDAQAK